MEHLSREVVNHVPNRMLGGLEGSERFHLCVILLFVICSLDSLNPFVKQEKLKEVIANVTWL